MICKDCGCECKTVLGTLSPLSWCEMCRSFVIPKPADAEVVKVPVSALDHGRTYWYRLANRAAAEIAELKKQVKFLTANGEAHWKNYREANGQLNYFGNALVSAKQDRDAYKNEVEELKVKERIAREALKECEAKLAAAEKRAEPVPELVDAVREVVQSLDDRLGVQPEGMLILEPEYYTICKNALAKVKEAE